MTEHSKNLENLEYQVLNMNNVFFSQSSDEIAPILVNNTLNKYILKIPRNITVKPKQTIAIDLEIDISIADNYFGIVESSNPELYSFQPIILMPNKNHHLILNVTNNSKSMSIVFTKNTMISYLTLRDRHQGCSERYSHVIVSSIILSLGLSLIGFLIYLGVKY